MGIKYMIEALELEWKVGGLLPITIDNDCIYYNQHEDKTYSKRVFGSPQFDFSTTSLEPTKQFHQALNAELHRSFNLRITRLPYFIPVGDLGKQAVKLKLRLFENRFLMLSIQLQCIENDFSVTDIIKLQKLSSHPILESIARFCFNVHHCPNPSQMIIKGWQCKPLIKIVSVTKPLDDSSLVEIVTRHVGLDQRSITEMLEKNFTLNFNSDKLLIDKQGVVFLQTSTDKENQRNRFKRISALFEYAVYVKAIDSIQAEYSDELGNELQPNLDRINEVLNADILLQSVSGKRGWELLKKEMNLKVFNCSSDFIEKEDNENTKSTKLHFYKNPIFLGTVALVGLIAGILKILKELGGQVA
jgi:hypothetical protein